MSKGDSSGVSSLVLDPKYWETLANGKFSVLRGFDRADFEGESARNEMASCNESLREDGFLNGGPFPWQEDVSFEGIVELIHILREAGWAPVFIFMYDEVYRVIDNMWCLMKVILGEECVLEPSVFAWSVQPKNENNYIGANFSLPHRDYTFDESCFPDHTPKLLNVWIPLTDVDVNNGCMYVVPKEFDPNFDKPKTYAHMRSAVKVSPRHWENNQDDTG
eukprot:GFYU01064646.1.p1 GENE.GFYU01064646.1~~GFYU01064646.1.p1  ORF type:complete len:220 (-),score=51.75 GFYU01064646.1:72-731(-)